MSGSKNNHYFVGGKLYVIPKEVADIVDETESRLTKERDALRAENDQLRSENESLKNGLTEIANSAGIDGCGFTSGEKHANCVWKAREILKKVTE